MSRDQRFPELEMQRLFDDAVERFLAGEPFDLIIEDAPTSLQAELAARLSVVQQTQRVRTIPVPPPRRSEQNRAAFLAQAVAMRNGAQPLPAAASEPVPTKPAAQPTPQRRPFGDLVDGLFEGMRGGLQTLPGSAVALVVLLIAAMGVTTTVKAAADEAVPGETAFAVQEWIWRQELMLSPPARVQEVEIAQEAARTEAIQAAAAQADLNNIIIEETSVVPLRAALSGFYDVGSMIVSPTYQPDPNVQVFENMEIIGDLAPGAYVELTYRILPGQTGSQGKPLVQGVRMRVLAPPPPPPVPTPQSVQAPPPTLTPTAAAPMIVVTPVDDPGSFEFVTPAIPATNVGANAAGGQQPVVTLTPLSPPSQPVQPPACQPAQPLGWTNYVVQYRDTLTSLAGGDPRVAAAIIAANCLPIDKVIAGATIVVPPSAANPPTATPVVPQLPPTLTPMGTQPGGLSTVTPALPPTVIPDATPTVLPTDDGTTTNPTVGPTPEATVGTVTPLTPTGVPPVTVTPPEQTPGATATMMPTGGPTALPTPIATGTGPPTDLPPTLTPATTADATPGVPPTGTPLPTTQPTALPTGPVIVPPTGEATTQFPPTVTPGLTVEPTQLPPATLPPNPTLPPEAPTVAPPTLTATPGMVTPGPNATATDLPPPPVEPAATSPPVQSTATAVVPVTPTNVPTFLPPDLFTTPTQLPPPVATNTQPPVPPTVPAATARPTLPPAPLSTNTPVPLPTLLPTSPPPPTALPTLPPPPTMRPTLPPPPPTALSTLPPPTALSTLPPPTALSTLPPPPTATAYAP